VLHRTATEGKETIGYDEYMDGGIPDTLLEGLGFYKNSCGTETEEGENTDVMEEDVERVKDEVNESPFSVMKSETQSKNLFNLSCIMATVVNIS
jgi:hypothetical protein